MSKKVKIAVVGVGNISNYHIRAYLESKNAELYAFCDIDADRLKAQGEKYGVTRLYTDEKTMLRECPEIDAVSVCTWNSQHAPCTIAALEAGKDVLCEKPMALNADEAQTMIDAAKKNGRKLMVGFVRRFGDDAAAVKEFAASGNIGDIYYAKALYLRRHGNPGGWFGDKKRSGGGPLIDLGVHVIDLVRYLAGRPAPVSVFGATFHKLGNRADFKDKAPYVSSSARPDDVNDVEDFAAAMIRFENGLVLSVETSFDLNIADNDNAVKMFGTKGGVTLDPTFALATDIDGRMVNVAPYGNCNFDFVQSFNKEIDFFVEGVRSGADFSEFAEDGKTLMRILDAIYLSAATGKEVRLDR